MADIPILTTERLIVRGHRLADFKAMAAMWAEPETVRYIAEGKPLAEDVVWARLQRVAGSWPMLGYGFWAIEEGATGRVIGEIGFLERLWPGGGVSRPEAGWGLCTAARGRGYASEALKAVLAWGDQRFERSICVIAPENLPSLKLAHAHGYVDAGPADWAGAQLVMLDRQRPAAQ
jgi:RimJ/RimL family protein N-acetyltransferase